MNPWPKMPETDETHDEAVIELYQRSRDIAELAVTVESSPMQTLTESSMTHSHRELWAFL